MKRFAIFLFALIISAVFVANWLYHRPAQLEHQSMEWVKDYDLKPGNNAMVDLLDSINQWDLLRINELHEPNDFKKFVYKFRKPVRARLRETLTILQNGNTNQAIQILESMSSEFTNEKHSLYIKYKEMLGVAYLRWGEQENCIVNHGSNSCILPISGNGVYSLQENTRKAIGVFGELLSIKPDDWRYRWVINVAYQTLGEYPEKVPEEWLIESELMKDNNPLDNFKNIAPQLGVDFTSNAGGAILEDFNNDGLLDIFTSGHLKDQLKFYINNGSDGFVDQTSIAGLDRLIGGFNLYQLDYNNDGWNDLLVVRGAWGDTRGLYPNSLLKNNKDGSFSDVTVEANVLAFNPNATAVCADFNNDGWTDFYVGNESRQNGANITPNQLFLNAKNGTFIEVSKESASNIECFTKGLTAGDYDNDGRIDLFISNHMGDNYLLKNTGNSQTGIPQFEDVSKSAGLETQERSFTPWFWDFNNDGLLDLFVSSFEYGNGSSAASAAKHFAGIKDSTSRPHLYLNNGDGTFTNKAEKVGLDFPLSTMGANFGDLNNDGWLDFYIGTGEPDYLGIHPNRVIINQNGKSFVDKTFELGLGHIQKGHGISFGDIDNDGDQDILAEMGGEYFGDEFQNALFQNPGTENNWVTLKLTGSKSSKDAIGTELKLVVSRNDSIRYIYRVVSSGGSFGANSLQQEIGIGKNDQIDSVIINWPNSDYLQYFENIPINSFYLIDEKEGISDLNYKNIEFKMEKPEYIKYNWVAPICR